MAIVSVTRLLFALLIGQLSPCDPREDPRDDTSVMRETHTTAERDDSVTAGRENTTRRLVLIVDVTISRSREPRNIDCYPNVSLRAERASRDRPNYHPDWLTVAH